jgi:hypothetical protein
MICACIVEINMDEKKQAPTTPPVPEPAAKQQPQTPPPPRWQDMIYPERRHDPLRWLRH